MFAKVWVHTLLLLIGNLQQWAPLEVSVKPVYHNTLTDLDRMSLSE